MTDPTVRSDRRGSLAVITLDRPEQRNPLDRDTAEALLDAFRLAAADPGVRSIAITGAGEAFCAGGDLRQMGEFRHRSGAEAHAWPQPIVDLHQELLRSPVPVMAAVNGPAFAGGMGLAGACDVVLAVRGATFAMPEAKIGLFPMIIVAHLCRSLPRKLLLEMMFTGDPIDADEAHRVGFVNKVYDTRDALDAGLDEYAARFARVGPQAVRLGRQAFSLLADLPASQALETAQFFNVPFFLGDELQEGAAAFLERRRPSWVEEPSDEEPSHIKEPSHLKEEER